MTATAILSILELTADPALLGPWFKDRDTWRAWFAFLSVLFGDRLTKRELKTFKECTNREAPDRKGYREAWLCVGRRGGKSLILAVIAVYLAVFRSWSQYLVPGERATILIVCVDRKQARTILRYMTAMFAECALLRPYLDGEPKQDEIELTNGVLIEVGVCSFRSIRGRTLIACLADEIAFWRSDDSANPDSEILEAIRPAMASVPGAMLLAASSPYARRGVLWEAFRKHFGQPSPVLVWKAPTKTMNPTIGDDVIAEAYERDASRASAEYGAEFRSDIESYISREAVDAVTEPGRRELPHLTKHRYLAFVDPSGGSSDSFTLAIAHREGEIGEKGIGVLDAVREFRPPFSPDGVVGEMAELLRSYEISSVSGDRYGGEWPRERFREHDIKYEVSERVKNDIYRELLPLVNGARVELLDNPRLVNQMTSLERRTARGGRDSVDHPPGGHDDLANAVAGALVLAAGKPNPLEIWTKL